MHNELQTIFSGSIAYWLLLALVVYLERVVGLGLKIKFEEMRIPTPPFVIAVPPRERDFIPRHSNAFTDIGQVVHE